MSEDPPFEQEAMETILMDALHRGEGLIIRDVKVESSRERIIHKWLIFKPSISIKNGKWKVRAILYDTHDEVDSRFFKFSLDFWAQFGDGSSHTTFDVSKRSHDDDAADCVRVAMELMKNSNGV